MVPALTEECLETYLKKAFKGDGASLHTAQPDSFVGFTEARFQLPALLNMLNLFLASQDSHRYSQRSSQLLYNTQEIIQDGAGQAIRDYPASHLVMCERGLKCRRKVTVLRKQTFLEQKY